jgi:small basic protein
LTDDWVGITLDCVFRCDVGEEFSPEFELANDFTEIDDVKGSSRVVLLKNKLDHLIYIEVFVLGVWNEDIVVFEKERKFGVFVLDVDHFGFGVYDALFLSKFLDYMPSVKNYMPSVKNEKNLFIVR